MDRFKKKKKKKQQQKTKQKKPKMTQWYTPRFRRTLTQSCSISCYPGGVIKWCYKHDNLSLWCHFKRLIYRVNITYIDPVGFFSQSVIHMFFVKTYMYLSIAILVRRNTWICYIPNYAQLHEGLLHRCRCN